MNVILKKLFIILHFIDSNQLLIFIVMLQDLNGYIKEFKYKQLRFTYKLLNTGHDRQFIILRDAKI